MNTERPAGTFIGRLVGRLRRNPRPERAIPAPALDIADIPEEIRNLRQHQEQLRGQILVLTQNLAGLDIRVRDLENRER